MVHIIYGHDSFRFRAALRAIRDALASSDDMLDTNTTVLDGSTVTASELLSHVSAVPFLGGARLVVVEGLLKRLGEQRRGRRTKKASPDDPLEEWRRLAEQLAADFLPATTTLVFVEGDLPLARDNTPSSPVFGLFAPLARVQAYHELQGGELGAWIRTAAGAKDVNLDPRAIAALAQLIGPDLWALDNELEKLASYARGEPVASDTLAEVVSAAQQSRIWDLADAIVQSDAGKASSALQRLLRDGEPPTLIAFMIVRQFRHIALVKDLRGRRVRPDEVERVTGLRGYRLKAVMDLANRYGWGDIRRAYAILLESDLAVKRGLQSDEPSLDLLVQELCHIAPVPRSRSTPRPAAAAPR